MQVRSYWKRLHCVEFHNPEEHKLWSCVHHAIPTKERSSFPCRHLRRIKLVSFHLSTSFQQGVAVTKYLPWAQLYTTTFELNVSSFVTHFHIKSYLSFYFYFFTQITNDVNIRTNLQMKAILPQVLLVQRCRVQWMFNEYAKSLNLGRKKWLPRTILALDYACEILC